MPYNEYIVNVASVGNCGFRVIASFMDILRMVSPRFVKTWIEK